MTNKICLVTGATAGIGKATATWLARMGATVIVVGRNREKAEAVSAEIRTAIGATTRTPHVETQIAHSARNHGLQERLWETSETLTAQSLAVRA